MLTTLLFALVWGVKGWGACCLPEQANPSCTCYEYIAVPPALMCATMLAETQIICSTPYTGDPRRALISLRDTVDNPCPRCGLGGVAVGVEAFNPGPRQVTKKMRDEKGREWDAGYWVQDMGWLLIRYVCPKRHTWTEKAIPVDRNDDKGGTAR